LKNTIDPSQPQIDKYFPILNELQQLEKQNTALRLSLGKLSSSLQDTGSSFNAPLNPMSPLLKLLLNAKEKRPYDPRLKQFAAFIYLRAGRRAYTTLSSNLPIPKPSTICKFLQSGKRINEGVVRYQELESFFNSRQLPKKNWLSEDATKITPKVQFDSTHGEIVGLCAPTAQNGFPIVSFFNVTSPMQLKSFIDKYEMPSYVYVYIVHSHSNGTEVEIFLPLCVWNVQ
jgi:hypothetical protein